MLYGFTGKILHVDLTTSKLTVETPDEAFYRTYVGGSAMGLYYLLKHTPRGADPLGPQNTLTLALSATTGFAVSGQSRCTAVAKSPITGGAGDAQAGGFWPAELKFAGFDALVFHGRAPSPVYLWVHNGKAELRPAEHLWGKTTADTEALIKDELGDSKIEIAEIGPAGEKQVRFAAIINMANRAFGRTGMGAVMGSKNLKAIAVRGTRRPVAGDPAAIKRYGKYGSSQMKVDLDMQEFGKYGTASTVMGNNSVGGLPTRNWSAGFFENAEPIDGVTMYDTILTQRDTCYSCAVRCKRVVESEYKGEPILPVYGGAEYENLATLGAYCGVGDLNAVSLANQLCNAYGVDAIAAGATIAFAMDCFERGILSEADTDGLALRFGDADAMLAMLRKLLDRQGFGDVLAEGSARAARQIGRGAEERVNAVKGAELPAHMPHVKRSLGLIYAVNPFGADHQSSEHDPGYMPQAGERSLQRLAAIGLNNPQKPRVLNEAKVEFALKTQYSYSAADSMNLCQFVYGPTWQLLDVGDMAQVYAAATGWETSIDDVQAIGQRRLNMLRAFNAREGLTRADDKLPRRMFNEALTGGKSDGILLDQQELEAAMDTYFAMAGWDVATGVPTRATLEACGLGWVADQLEATTP
ncbi:MAG: aldehyde ferredoxin oxidoreductase family protein [Kouleothrix sp.]|jgi:aldehyde:ferredoxin oxidoreductase|nr:aldehyde ferredoxin oxidoreductase family protein [Kouleothrix sp.]